MSMVFQDEGMEANINGFHRGIRADILLHDLKSAPREGKGFLIL